MWSTRGVWGELWVEGNREGGKSEVSSFDDDEVHDQGKGRSRPFFLKVKTFLSLELKREG